MSLLCIYRGQSNSVYFHATVWFYTRSRKFWVWQLRKQCHNLSFSISLLMVSHKPCKQNITALSNPSTSLALHLYICHFGTASVPINMHEHIGNPDHVFPEGGPVVRRVCLVTEHSESIQTHFYRILLSYNCFAEFCKLFFPPHQKKLYNTNAEAEFYLFFLIKS